MSHLLPEYTNDLPTICGHEPLIGDVSRTAEPVFLKDSTIDFSRIQSASAIALHMQQPLIPAGGHDLQSAALISNLQYMMENPGEGDNHNAGVFHYCYKRMGEIIPEMVEQGLHPRVMLDYSGCLLHGLRRMGLHDVFENLKRITLHPAYRNAVEWLGCTWGHAVAPSTPVQDYRLHVTAWQHHFAAIFGTEALSRVKGFSPAEMALPNHPDVAYEFVKTLVDCGFRWVLVQEHTVELPGTGGPVSQRHVPHQLVVRNAAGETARIIAVIKTQGSDTKLVAQMQPIFEAKTLQRVMVAGKSIPPLVTQIGDGENGGVMMNEFPPVYRQTIPQIEGSASPIMNVTEYLEHLAEMGVTIHDLPLLQPIHQKLVWDICEPGAGSARMDAAIATLKKENPRFHMDGGSWTNNISWVNGYDNVLEPMNRVSALFAQKVLHKGVPATDPAYHRALFHLLVTQTSCYRYWGQGRWTDYAVELCRRATEAIHAV